MKINKEICDPLNTFVDHVKVRRLIDYCHDPKFLSACTIKIFTIFSVVLFRSPNILVWFPISNFEA